MSTLYQIRRTTDGLYAGKTNYPASLSKWSKKGRTFTSLSFVKSHLRALHNYKRIDNYYMDVPTRDVEIVEWTLGQDGQQTIPLRTVLKEMGIINE